MGYQWQTSTKGLPPKRFQADRLASFKLLRGRWHDRQVTLCACDLLRLDGGVLRREPLERREALLA
jgi:ATP-dependent DNA ligase